MQSLLVLLFTSVIICLTIFQILLILGYPLGEFAWGGQHKVLPNKFRIASMSSILIYILFLLIFLSKVNVLNIISDLSFINTLFTAMTIYFGLGILLNLVSKSKKERYLMTPVATILFICCILVG